MADWTSPPPVDVSPALRLAVGGHPLVARVLAQRGIADPPSARAFLDADSYTPAPANDLPDMAEAVDRVLAAVDRGQTIAVWGDFDVDGQTATTLLVAALRALDAEVRYHIPVRARESHGVNVPALSELIDQGIGLLLTCDTGVASHEAIDLARRRGVTVVVTDHHDLPDSLPAAHAVVNPKRLPADHPLATLPGVGVAYKLAEALDAATGRPGSCQRYLDLVALGIVADVALQIGDTRYLLQRGLQALRRTQRLGLQALMAQAGILPAAITAESIGFALAPRLNALGRLDDANVIVDFLTTGDLTRARVLATQLEGLNARRQMETNQVLRAAQAQIERDPSLLNDAALVLAHPAWPAGIIGIVASRLAERYGRPVVLFATPPGQLARGSARSVEGCNISAAIAAQRELLHGYGGHPMAAGLSIEPERIPQFRRALARTVADMLGGRAVRPTLAVDGFLALDELTADLVADLNRLAPFGPGNPPLVLATGDLAITSQGVLGRTQEHREVVVTDRGGTSRRVVWWQSADLALPSGRFDLAYTVGFTSYRGDREVEVTWVDARPIEEPTAETEPVPSPIEVVDHRGQPDPQGLLARLREAGDCQVWCEGEAKRALAGLDRTELAPGPVLAVWTVPPGRDELRAAVAAVAPATLVLFGVEAGGASMQDFLQRLAGLVRYAMTSRGGRVSVRSLAAATAQRESTVRLGIAWLAARGHVTVQAHAGDELVLAAGGQADDGRSAALSQELKAALTETIAYRAHFRRADAATLLL